MAAAKLFRKTHEKGELSRAGAGYINTDDQPVNITYDFISDKLAKIKADSMMTPDLTPRGREPSNCTRLIEEYKSTHIFEGEAWDQSGRTRSATKSANQVNQTSEQTNSQADNHTKITRGRKRKKNATDDNQESDSENEDKGKRKPRLQDMAKSDEQACSCPKDVMTCIGILPSLPIITYFYDSDDSASSLNEDLSFTVLPTFNRNKDHHGN